MKFPLSDCWARPGTAYTETLPAPWIWLYAIWRGDECVYVGKTIDLRTRLAKHRSSWLKSGDPPVRECEVRVLLGQDEEQRLIMELEPYMNKMR